MKPSQTSSWRFSALFLLIVLTGATAWGQEAARDPFGDPADPASQADPFGGGHAEDPFGGGSSAGDPFGPIDDSRAWSPLPARSSYVEISPQKAPEGWDARTAEKRIRQALASDTKIDAIEVGLNEVMEGLAERHKIPIGLDRKVLEDMGMDPREPVTKQLEGVSLRSALDMMLRELGLCYVIRGEKLVITIYEVAETHLITRVYPVTDLISTYDEGAFSAADADSLIDILWTKIGAQRGGSWSEGWSGSITAMPIPNGMAIVASQSRADHQQIEQTLQVLRRVNKGGKLPCSIPVDFPGAIRAERTIQTQLRAKTSIVTLEMGLQDLIKQISEHHGIPIFIEKKAFDDMGLDPSTPVTCHYEDISLRSALKLILRPLGLSYMIHDEVLLITTPEQAETQLSVRVYPVANLVRTGTSDGPVSYDVDSLLDLITTMVEPQSWPCQTGPAPIDCIVLKDNVVMVLPQTLEVHEEIECLLRMMRKLDNIKTAGDEDKPSAAGESEGDDEPEAATDQPRWPRGVLVADPLHRQAVRRIEAALAAPVTFEAIELPFEELLDELSEMAKTPIILDRRAMEDIEFDPSTPVTCDFDGIRLDAVLDQVLGDCELTYILKNESIIVTTTPEQAECELEVRFYPVTDLVELKQKGDKTFLNTDALEELVVTALARNSWGAVGGLGSLVTVYRRSGVFLAVSQTREVHKQIDTLLLQLRQVNKREKGAAAVYHCRPESPADFLGISLGPDPFGPMILGSDTFIEGERSVRLECFGPKSVVVGEKALLWFRVTNEGKKPIPRLMLSEKYEAGLRHSTTTANPMEVHLGPLAPGQSQQVDLEFEVIKAGNWSHTVTLSDGQVLIQRTFAIEGVPGWESMSRL